MNGFIHWYSELEEEKSFTFDDKTSFLIYKSHQMVVMERRDESNRRNTYNMEFHLDIESAEVEERGNGDDIR